MSVKQTSNINRLKRLFSENKQVAIIEIGYHITEKGNLFGIELKCKWPVHYRKDNESCSSHYSAVWLDECNKIQVKLTNGVCIPEKSLNIKHIEDILCIIDFELTHYEKPKK